MVNGEEKRIHNYSGSILIVSLWILTIFVLLVLSLGYRSNLEATLSVREKEYFDAEQILFSGINVARYYINADEEPSVDSTYDTWYNQIKIAEDVWPSGSLSIRIVDEESKISINQAKERELTSLFLYIEEEIGAIEVSTEDLVSSILYWRGDSSIKGKSSLGYDYKKEPFESLEELLLLPDITEADFVLIKDYLTVYTDSGNTGILTINLNTASLPVLKSVIISLSGDEQRKKELFKHIVEFRLKAGEYNEANNEGDGQKSEEREQYYFTDKDLTAHNFLACLGMSSDVINISLVIQLLQHCTIDSKYFSVTIDVTIKNRPRFRTVEVMLGPARGGVGGSESEGMLDVFSWREL